MQELLPKLIGVFGAVFLFGFAVFVHELGHFLVAKFFGVGVRKFAIGFGPKIWSFTRGETEYSLRWIPLGGFVALKGMIEGMDEEPSADASPSAAAQADASPETKRKGSVTEDLDALRSQPPAVRIAVFGAGVTMNFLTAIALTVVLLWYGVPKLIDLPNTLDEVPTGSRLYEWGWRSGDAILQVQRRALSGLGGILAEDGSDIPLAAPLSTWNEVESAIVRELDLGGSRGMLGRLSGKDALSSATLYMTVERERRRLVLPFTLGALDEQERASFSPPQPAYIGGVIPASPAHRTRLVKRDYRLGEPMQSFPAWDQMPSCPLQMGDTVVEVDGKPVSTWREMTRYIRAKPGEMVTLAVSRDGGKEILLLATTLEHSDEAAGKGQLGVMAGLPDTGERAGVPLSEALAAAPMRTLQYAGLIISETVKVFGKSGREIRRNIGGPAVIGILAYQSAQRGLSQYLNLFIAISIVLAVMNLLPIPVLDGGYILITVIEAVIRRPIPQKILAPVLTTFMTLFMALFIFLFYNDFMNWVIKR